MTQNAQTPQEDQDWIASQFEALSDQVSLTFSLIRDSRVNWKIKALFFLASLGFFISPFDFPTPLDDIGIIYAFSFIFVKLCPPEVVEELRTDPNDDQESESESTQPPESPAEEDEDIIEGTFTDVDDDIKVGQTTDVHPQEETPDVTTFA